MNDMDLQVALGTTNDNDGNILYTTKTLKSSTNRMLSKQKTWLGRTNLTLCGPLLHHLFGKKVIYCSWMLNAIRTSAENQRHILYQKGFTNLILFG